MNRTPGRILFLLLFAALSGALVVNAQKKTAVKPTKAPAKAESSGTAKLDLLGSLREKEILAEINLARTNPQQYAKYLEDFRPHYQGKELRFDNEPPLITDEGISALDEAITFVRSLKPLAPLELRKGLILGARDHLADLLKTGRSGHRGSDGSITEERLNRYGRWSNSVGEDIVYRSRKPREDVISLIIDDGVKSRGHRKNIFKPEFRVIGLALSSLPKSDSMCVITFAGGFVDKNSNGAPVNAARPF